MSATTAMRRDPPARRDRSHYLYLAVLAAVGAGIVVGFAARASPWSSSRSAPGS